MMSMAKETTLDGVTVTSGVTGMASALDDLIKIFGAGDDAASLREVMAMSKEIDQEQDRQIQHGDDDLGRVEEMLQQKLRMKQDDLESDISNEIIEISERRAEVSRLSDSLLEQIDSVDGELKQKKLLIRELDSKRNEIEQKHNSKMMQLSRNHTLLSKLGIQWEANCDQMDEFIHEYKGFVVQKNLGRVAPFKYDINNQTRSTITKNLWKFLADEVQAYSSCETDAAS